MSCVICSNMQLLCATLGFWISRKLQESAEIERKVISTNKGTLGMKHKSFLKKIK